MSHAVRCLDVLLVSSTCDDANSPAPRRLKIPHFSPSFKTSTYTHLTRTATLAAIAWWHLCNKDLLQLLREQLGWQHFHTEVCKNRRAVKSCILKSGTWPRLLPLTPVHYNGLTFTSSPIRWAGVENHLHRISGSRMTASHSLFHVIPDNERKTRRGCASASVNFRDTCPSPRYFSSPAPRLVSLLCFHPPSPPPPPKQRT